MCPATLKEPESVQNVLDFLHSEMEKVYLVIGPDERQRLRFVDTIVEQAGQDERNRVFQHEIWKGEHSRHFLYRWLNDTAFGYGFKGFGAWEEVLDRDSHLKRRLRMLVEEDIRPLEVRFVEALRFLAGTLEPEERVILSIVPRTLLEDRNLVDFFREVLRLLPPKIKFLISLDEADVLARQTDFSPSNRAILEESESGDVSERYADMCGKDTEEGRMLALLGHLVHPVDPALAAHLTGGDTASVEAALRSPLLKDLVEELPDRGFRVAFPRSFPSSCVQDRDFSDMDRKAAAYCADLLNDPEKSYPSIVYHSLALFRLEDGPFVASHALDTRHAKMKRGWGDICEEELERALALVAEEDRELRARLFLALGEVREARKRNREAVEALENAETLLRETGPDTALQRALELKGRAAFSLRDTDTAKAALEEAVRIARETGDRALAADGLSQLAYIHFSIKDLDKAEALYRESLETYQEFAHDVPEEGRAGEAAQWANLGHTAYAAGDFKKAEEYHRKSLEIYESLGDRKAEAAQWGYLGHTFFAAPDFEQAIQAYERAAKIEEEMGEPLRAAQRYASIGHTLYAQRRADLALHSFQKALEKYREMGDAEGEAAQLSSLGMVTGDEGKYEESESYFQESARLYRELGDPVNEASQFVRLAHVLQAQKKYGEAEQRYQEAMERYRALEYPMGQAAVELDLGKLHSDQGRWEKAVECFQRAKKIYADMGHREQEALCESFCGHAERARGRWEAALPFFRRALDLYKEMNNTLGVANVTSQMGLLHFEQKNYEEAERLYREALKDFEEKEDREGRANLLCNLGTLYYETGKTGKARKEYEEALSILRKMNHPLGIAGVLQNLSYVFEQEKRYGDAAACLKEARELYHHLRMDREAEEVERRLTVLEDQAGKALESLRSELFPGLSKTEEGKDSSSSKRTKVGRNDPCPCGSGKKYKKCCGA